MTATGEVDARGTVPNDGPSILAAAEAVAPELRAAAVEIEEARRLPARVVELVRATGAFRMPMPTAWGGPEVDPVTQVLVIEALSRANASAGWCAMIGSDGGYYSAFLDDEVGRSLYADLDAVTAGAVFPAGQLEQVGGGDEGGDGYRLNGRWSFGSGITHADLVIGGALVLRDGQPVMDGDGPALRWAIAPAASFDVVDTWFTTGLAGTGSNDYTATGITVPAAHTWSFREPVRREGALYRLPAGFLHNMAGVPLGVARDAIDTVAAVAQTKVVVPAMTLLRQEARVQHAVAKAEALVGSARAYVLSSVADAWETTVAGDDLSVAQRAALFTARVHAFQSCRDAVQLMYDTLGGSAIYASCPLDRHLRDLQTAAQHAVCNPKMLDMVGALRLGIDPGPAVFYL